MRNPAVAPPPDRVSSAKQRIAPNWVLKTAMAATGVLLALVLVAKLICVAYFFLGGHNNSVREVIWSPGYGYFAPVGGWTVALRVTVVVLLVVHASIGAILVVRARTAVATRLRGRWHAWLTRLMPYTGVMVGLFAIVYALDQFWHLLVPGPLLTDVWLQPELVPVIDPFAALTKSLAVPWIAVVYIVGLLVLAAHVMTGLGTVATIAAGNSALVVRVKRWVGAVGGVVISVLFLVAMALTVTGLLGRL